jgi:hypothetical protein
MASARPEHSPVPTMHFWDAEGLAERLRHEQISSREQA